MGKLLVHFQGSFAITYSQRIWVAPLLAAPKVCFHNTLCSNHSFMMLPPHLDRNSEDEDWYIHHYILSVWT